MGKLGKTTTKNKKRLSQPQDFSQAAKGTKLGKKKFSLKSHPRPPLQSPRVAADTLRKMTSPRQGFATALSTPAHNFSSLALAELAA
jgi:hypothetical protein